jgi:hypothetical protein
MKYAGKQSQQVEKIKSPLFLVVHRKASGRKCIFKIFSNRNVEKDHSSD